MMAEAGARIYLCCGHAVWGGTEKADSRLSLKNKEKGVCFKIPPKNSLNLDWGGGLLLDLA
jgi:hypothetical protein